MFRTALTFFGRQQRRVYPCSYRQGMATENLLNVETLIHKEQIKACHFNIYIFLFLQNAHFFFQHIAQTLDI